MNNIDVQSLGTLGLAVYVLVEIFKKARFPNRYAPLLSLILGIGIGSIGFLLSGKPWLEGLQQGFWAAAAASGVYAGSKSVFTRKNTLSTAQDDPALHPPC